MENNKTIIILGADGYLGYSLSIYLRSKGYGVVGVDSYYRRAWVSEIGSHSAIPLTDRKVVCDVIHKDINDYDWLKNFLKTYKPEAIVHLAEQPSAPFSMIDQYHSELTHTNNVNGTLKLIWAIKESCPNVHLIKLGTMGEYGTPNVPIPEGHFEVKYRGRTDVLPFPKQPGSFYHLTKVHDSHNIEFACKNWNLKSTDINQGPVYGTRIDEMKEDQNMRTRFDFDHVFGTVINRFCAQALIGYPLTVYGKGNQVRGYININDSMKCIELVIQNPPDKGEYRVINQWIERLTLNELAKLIKRKARKLGYNPSIDHIDNPRNEKEKHYYNPDNNIIYELGLKARGLESIIEPTLRHLSLYKKRIKQKEEFIKPSITWNKGKQ